MNISVLVVFVFFLLAAAGYSQEKIVTIKNTIGNGKEVYQVKDKKSNIRQGSYWYKYGNSVRIKGQYENDSKQGNWQYAIGNNFVINAFYNKGKKDSLWTYTNGDRLISEVKYRNDKREGTAIGYYNKRDNIQSTIPYQNNKIDGIKKTFYENGNIKFEVKYVKDTIDGDVKYYSIDGKVILHIIYKNGSPFSLEIMDLPDSIRYISGNLKDGTGSISVYSKNSKTDSIILISQREYSNGLLEGKCTEYENNGKIKFTGNYIHNFMVGQWNFYDPHNPRVHVSKAYSIKDSIRTDSTDLYPVVLASCISDLFKQDMPKFYTNDQDGFRTFISNSLEYPATALQSGTMGRVYTQFVVDITGTISNIKVINSNNDDFKKEAIRVLKTSPNWIPGFHDNIPCNVSYIFPITFIMK